MSKGKRAFEALAIENQKCLMDLASAWTVITTRLPGTSNIAPLVAEYAKQTGLGLSLANYAMQEIWRAMFDQDWQFIVTKKGDELVTQFIPARTGDGGNGEPGEQTTERPRIIAP